MWKRLLECSRSKSDPFGIEYQFSLFDQPPNADTGAKQAAVNAPEWLVPLGAELDELAEECGFEVILCQNFHQFIDETLKSPSSLRLMTMCPALLSLGNS